VPQINALSSIDTNIIQQIELHGKKISEAIENFRFREALAELMNLARTGNKYLAEQEPWKTAKTDMQRTAEIIYTSLQICAALSNYAEPFLPFTAKKLQNQLNTTNNTWISKMPESGYLPAGHTIAEPQLLFAKMEDDVIEHQISKLNATKVPSAPASLQNTAKPMKPEIQFDDFTKMDIRTGTILEAEKVEGADKLLKLLVDTGIDKRVIVSGIALHFNPDEIVGRQVSVLLNLAPRKIRGVTSHGMILMAEDALGKLTFVKPEISVDNGSEIR
jgi:methionyl-tRNA synthetase